MSLHLCLHHLGVVVFRGSIPSPYKLTYGEVDVEGLHHLFLNYVHRQIYTTPLGVGLLEASTLYPSPNFSQKSMHITFGGGGLGSTPCLSTSPNLCSQTILCITFGVVVVTGTSSSQSPFELCSDKSAHHLLGWW